MWFGWGEEVEDQTYCAPQCSDRPLGPCSRQRFELGEGLLDWLKSGPKSVAARRSSTRAGPPLRRGGGCDVACSRSGSNVTGPRRSKSHRHHEAIGKGRSRPAAKREPQVMNDRLKTSGPSPQWSQNIGAKRLGKNAAAKNGVAPEAANNYPHETAIGKSAACR
ncbi:hypothetical protein [Mesorhizobium sp.]|uniref:hypothetical protein n=1 Tax=Mesorhizobium sp. TaxID=1871066 RepID=UPI000FE865FB|nr:hypothetical protein [Mesorhizobium sp.]RWA78929.1 MAG: hypothetical protein EOQ32_32100 [Mesorhizobium sp.]